ncbi:MAG: hypothetical protein JWQ79_2258 [Mucilaginibacter sp.]|jgi:hypothetical protein|nr:hypothetical protein [Mucilaginibacter sp.]
MMVNLIQVTIMKTADKHYKFINSRTGYVIYYHSLKNDLPDPEIKKELEKVKAQVATQNEVFYDTIYWEEIKEE